MQVVAGQRETCVDNPEIGPSGGSNSGVGITLLRMGRTQADCPQSEAGSPAGIPGRRPHGEEWGEAVHSIPGFAMM